MRISSVTISYIVVGLVTVDTAVSQQRSFENERPYNVGFKGGINQSTIAGFNNEATNFQSGYQFGIFMNANILEDWFGGIRNLGLRVELNYLKSGTQIADRSLNRMIFDGTELFVDAELHGFEFERDTGGPFTPDEIFDHDVYSNITFLFVEAPFLINYSIPARVISPYVFAGPSFSVLADLDYNFTLNTAEGDSYTQEDIDQIVDQHFRKFNIGADIGFGIRFPFGVFVEAEYSWGLTNTLEFYEHRMNHRTFLANVGVQF